MPKKKYVFQKMLFRKKNKLKSYSLNSIYLSQTKGSRTNTSLNKQSECPGMHLFLAPSILPPQSPLHVKVLLVAGEKELMYRSNLIKYSQHLPYVDTVWSVGTL